MLSICKSFIREFFDQNPLSQLGIIIMRNGLAERLTELSASPEAQVKRLAAYTQGAGWCRVREVGFGPFRVFGLQVPYVINM